MEPKKTTLIFNGKLSFFILSVLLVISCTQQNNHLQVNTLQSKSLENALLQVNPEKKIAVYLPPSYFETSKEYPVVYYLSGYTSPIDELIRGEYEGFRLKNVMDELIQKEQIREMIVVLCDGSNYLGGNFYVNSPLTGNAEDYIVEDIVNYVDNNYRTIKSAQARGITGHSMGGFGSFNIATKHPDIFSACYSISPGIYSETGLHDQGLFNSEEKLRFIQDFLTNVKCGTNSKEECIKSFKKEIKPLFESYDSYFTAFTIAYGAAFNHNTEVSFPHIEFPAKITTTENLNEPIFYKWQKDGFGNWLNKIEERRDNIEKLKAIAFDCGTNDAWITNGTKYIAEAFKANNISAEFLWYEGGHDDQLHIRLKEYMLPYFSQKLIHKN